MKALKLMPAVILLGLILLHCSPNNGWRTASRESSKIAPDPASTNEAILHVYGADTWGWRGWFAIHSLDRKAGAGTEVGSPLFCNR